MNVYIKSAGHNDTQDYVWFCVNGNDVEADIVLLEEAERKVSTKGYVVSWAEDKQSSMRVLFIGNAPSGRVDFYGTPIFNHLGIVFDTKNAYELQFAEQLASDWKNTPEKLTKILKECVTVANTERGFSCSVDIVNQLEYVLKSTDHIMMDKTKVLKSENVVNNQTNELSKDKENYMHISIHTVPSGEQDYEWCFGGRPTYANKLWDIAERIRTTDGEKVFFAVLAHECGKWILFVRDIIGKDTIVCPPRDAGCAIAIEIPDKENGAERVRRLLVAWLDTKNNLRNAVAETMDRAGCEVKVNEYALYEAVKRIADDNSLILRNDNIQGGQYIVRLAKDLSDRSEARNITAEFVKRFQFLNKDGVHLLFASTPYSTDPNDPDCLPNIVAPFIVIGHRDNERGESIIELKQMMDSSIGDINMPPTVIEHSKQLQSGTISQVSWYSQHLVVLIIAFCVGILALLFLFLHNNNELQQSQVIEQVEIPSTSSITDEHKPSLPNALTSSDNNEPTNSK